MAWAFRRVTAGLLAVTASSCGGQTGAPAAPTAISSSSFDATTAGVEAAAPPPAPALLRGVVLAADAGVPGAVLVVEVGGLDRPAPAGLAADGGLAATIDVDPFIRYAGLTDDAGAFSLTVPVGEIGLHVFSAGRAEQRLVALAVPSLDAAAPEVQVGLAPLPRADGGGGLLPTVTELTASSAVVGPLAPVTFAVKVAAGAASDPLSGDIFLVQPAIGWAGALAPPSPAVPGGPHPDGVYSLLVEAPAAPGDYTYVVVAASMRRVPGLPASVVVTVTPTGAPSPPDASSPPDGAFVADGGGLPDGRR